MASNIKILDPVQGLIDYVNDIKPYHTKVIEALIEYVGTETVNVTVLEDFTFELGMLYEFDGVYVCLLGGYGTPWFGDPEGILVSSPDVTKTILEYPAIGDGYFIVLGDRTTVFDPSVNIDLAIASSIEDKIVGVTPASGSPLSGGEFFVTGNKTTSYSTGVAIRITGTEFNDGNYTVATSVALGSPSATRITVNEAVPSTSVSGFVSVTSAINSGTFTVLSSEYITEHFIPHTIVNIAGVVFSAPTLVDDNQRFVAVVSTQPLEYNSILGYSTALRLLETGSPDVPYYAADEGTVISAIVNSTTTSFSVLGNFESSNIFVGDELNVIDSTGNNGTYIITSITYEYAGSPVSNFVTTFGVAAVPDVNIDGSVKLYIPSNVIIVDGGDFTKFFVQGSRVNATTGSHIGTYTTLNSRFVNDKTFIRVRETLINAGEGTLILSTGANYIVVDGDLTAVYGGSPAQQFNIVGSLKNNGLYTSTAVTYNGSTTQISIAEPFDAQDASGEIHPFTAGDITYVPEGFGATLDLCEMVPQQLTISTFTERLDLVMGHEFTIDHIETGGSPAGDKIYILDSNNYAYNIFNAGFNPPTEPCTPLTIAGSPPLLGSPQGYAFCEPFVPDANVKIISSGINNGNYIISSVIDAGEYTILIVAGSPALQNSGTGSPVMNSGKLLYKNWYQYYITNISGSPLNTFTVAGDATTDIADTDTIEHIFTHDIYTVSGAPVFDGTNTTITVLEPIVTIVGSPPVDVTVGTLVGSPPVLVPFDDWIISI